MSLQVSYKKQVILGFLLLLSLLTVLEIGARTYDYFNPYCSLKTDTTVYSEMSYSEKAKICDSWLSLVWHWEDDTNVYTLEPNQHKETVNINNHGFRGADVSIIKNDETYRIFVVGGSTTISLRAPSDDTTHPGYIQELFVKSDLDFKVEVVNAGTPSFTSTEELSVVKNKIINFDPDMIIIYDGSNDLNLPYGHTPAKTSLRSIITDGLNRYLPFWETIPVTYHILNQAVSNEPSYHFDTSTTTKKVNLWKDNLKKICDVGKQENFDVIILLQPILGAGNKKLTDYEQQQYEIFEHEKVVASYAKFANQLSHLDDHCTKSLDFRNIFDKYEGEIYFDNTHIKYQANEFVAENIFTEIYPIISNFDKNQ